MCAAHFPLGSSATTLSPWSETQIQLKITFPPASSVVRDCLNTAETLVASDPGAMLPFRPLRLSWSQFCLKSSMEQARVQRTEGIIWEQISLI